MDKHDVICDIMQILINFRNTAEYEQKASDEYLKGISDSIYKIRKYRKQGKWMK